MNPNGQALSRIQRIEILLKRQFVSSQIYITDDSKRHIYHVHRRNHNIISNETHYKIEIISVLFTNMSKVKRSRLVHIALRDEFDCGLHAVELKLYTPEEKEANND